MQGSQEDDMLMTGIIYGRELKTKHLLCRGRASSSFSFLQHFSSYHYSYWFPLSLLITYFGCIFPMCIEVFDI